MPITACGTQGATKTMTFNGLGGTGIVFSNNGTFRKSGGTNVTSPDVGQWSAI